VELAPAYWFGLHSVRERVGREDVALHYVPSEEKNAELLTKTLRKGRLNYV
jgi:hypothetical protein